MISAADVLFLTKVLAAIALLLQGFEVWKLRSRLDSLHLRFSNAVIVSLLGAQCLSAALLFGPMLFRSLGAVVLFLSTLAMSAHFRGRFSGGADSMSLVVLSALVFASIYPEWTQVSLIYVAIQSLLSYGLAGIVKLKNSKWRSGQVLESLLSEASPYVFALNVEQKFRLKRWSLPCSWGLILFELCAFVAWMNPYLLGCWIVLAVGFHLTNFRVLGLNRFFWIWIATYPSIFFLQSLFS